MQENHFLEYGAKLKRYRESAYYTQIQVGDACGVSPLTVSSWECGRTLPSLENCTKLTRLYNMPPESHDLVKVAQMSKNELIKTLYELLQNK